MSDVRDSETDRLSNVVSPRPSSPLVSVVVPTRNRTVLLARAIRSVRAQTYSNLEIIVVDDASDDDVQSVVESFGDPRIRYIRHSINRGGSGARNTGIRAATGEFIAFLDDDDEWEPTKTAEQLQHLRRYDAVLCTSDEANLEAIARRHKTVVDLEDLRRGRFTAGGTGVLMARTTLLKDVLFDEALPCYQDWDVFIRIAQRSPIGYLDRPLVRYNEGMHDRISNKIVDMPMAELEKRALMLRKHEEFFGSRWFKRHMGQYLIYGIKHRRNKWQHLRQALQKCGYRAVAWALLKRFFPRMADSIN